MAALQRLRDAQRQQPSTQTVMQVAARIADFAAGPEVQQRRQRTRSLLDEVLLSSGRTVQTAQPEDVTTVLLRSALNGRTSSRDGELKGVAASQALQNVAGDLRRIFNEERSAQPWEPGSGRGNPACSVLVADFLDGYAKYLLSKGVAPQAAPAMTRSDPEAWIEAAWAQVARERAPAARLRAIRNACCGTVLAAVGTRSVELLRCDWDCLLEPKEGEGAAAGKIRWCCSRRPSCSKRGSVGDRVGPFVAQSSIWSGVPGLANRGESRKKALCGVRWTDRGSLTLKRAPRRPGSVRSLPWSAWGRSWRDNTFLCGVLCLRSGGLLQERKGGAKDNDFCIVLRRSCPAGARRGARGR